MKKITIKGQDFPCRVTMGAMVRFKHECGKDVSKIDQSDVSDSVLLLWCCVASACAADGVEFPYTFGMFADSLSPQDISSFYEGMPPQKKTEKP